MTFNANSKAAWVLPAFIVVTMGLVLWIAPEEQSLGSGIKIVYLHVALIWSAMAGFLLNGLLGIGLASTNSEKLHSWMQAIGLVSLLVFVASVIVSLLAEQINWGGILWSEPRNQAVFTVTAVAIIVLVLNSWLPWLRLKGILTLALAVFVLLTLPGAPKVLHPENPARASSSPNIQYAFYVLTILSVAGGSWVTWYLKKARGLWPIAS